MFKFLRTVAEALGRAGLKVMTNGVRADCPGLTGCSAVAASKLLGVRCCVRGLLLFLEGGDCILVTPDSLVVHSSVY